MMNNESLTLYGMNSPNVIKVVIMLEELEVPYELRHVAVFKGEQFTPAFLSLNPLAKVPVLIDPQLDNPLAESGAILFYLAEKYAALLPGNGAERYEVMQWLMVQMASIGPMFGQLNHFQILPADREPYARGRYLVQAERLYRVLDEHLASREWIAGNACSIADIAIFPWSRYLERHGFDPEGHPALLRWRDAFAARPSVARVDHRTQQAFNALSNETRRTATAADLDRFFGRAPTMPPADFSAVTR